MSVNLNVVSQEAFVAFLPIDEPVAVFALALAAFLIAPILIERVGLPGIVGIVLAGTVIGPNGLGIIDHVDAIFLLGNVGLVYLLFIVGLELDLRRFRQGPEDAALFGLLSFSLPFIIGTAACFYLLNIGIWASMLLASVFASHTLLAYPIINQLDITKNSAVTAAFGGILFTDTLALVVLALVLAGVDGGLSATILGEVALSLLVLFGGIWLVVPPLARWFFRNLSQESYFEFLFVATLIFLGGSLAEALELAAILGAFVVGLALNRQITRGGTLMNRIEFFGNAFFIPFFLLHVGMLVDPGVILDGFDTIWLATVIVGVMVVTKVAAAGGVTAIQRYSREEFGVLVGLSVGQAAAALAITLIGFEAGLFDSTVLNAVVLMVLVSAILSPWLTKRFGTRLAQAVDIEGVSGEPFDPRILLPLSHTSEYQRRLIELAFALKDDPAEKPVHLLRVLSPQSTDEEIAQAEEGLRDTAEFGGAAEVPVEVETRVNHNIASGIVRAGTETRSDLILMGWDASRSLGGRVFGTIIDQVRRRTTDPVLVSRLGFPINTASRIIMVLPAGIDHHEGFYEAVFLTKRLAENTGIELEAIVVGDKTTQYERLVDLVEPEMELKMSSVASVSELITTLSNADEDDLLVALKPREDSPGWRTSLRRFPHELSDLPPDAFIIITPRQGDPGYAAKFLRID